MKQILPITALAVFIFLSTTKSFAQVTFYDNAPCITGSPSSGNYIDWRTQTFTIYTVSLGAQTVESPFYNTSLTNPNINEFSQYALKDYEPTDGWELLQYDFGTPSIGTDAPYLMLYNKHTGLLRAFIAFANLLGQNNGITLELSYVPNESRSALLENFSKSGLHATDNFDNNVPPISQNNFYVNQIMYWYHADFYLHYDPCICNYETALEFKVKLATNSTLQFSIEGQAIQNLNPPYSTDSYGRTGNIGNQTNNSNSSKVTSILRNLGKGADWANKLVQNKNNYLGLSPSQTSTLSNIFGMMNQFLPGIAGAADFLIGFFKDGQTAQPPRPLMLDINLMASGNITTSYMYGYKKIVAPGSEQTLISTIVRPYYNKAAGVFTLLKEPIIEWNDEIAYFDEWDPEIHEADTRQVYKLKDNISYALNPNADFDLSQSELKASLVFYNSNNYYETDYFNLGCLTGAEKEFEWITRNAWDGYSELGWNPQDIKLKIYARFKVTGSSVYIPYVATYNVKLIKNFQLYPDGQDALPDNSCITTLPEATAAEIKAICNANQYKDKVQQYKQNILLVDSSTRTYQDFKVFPNPSKEVIYVDLTSISKIGLNQDLELIDLSGRIVLRQKVQIGTVNTISLQGIPNGFYIGRIRNNEKELKFKFIKL